ncbi:hypothetical protein TWF569_009014 [Orbilia oligospora]|uniref:Uncharacterized protein n=1 Tax=Orbilia oligospora TaxID=2813651 RepID=A0A7C8J3W8_ORBOL|nr:hypothetical protein TWF102_008397 [Orbilia oligospora]KAF3096309.1 hypothetical protein TWF103_009882 [Orbilia oligospora]KAF3145451.1 hypothetical protein TWF594_004388 [Orbilia oligospora]KAF3155652.1 hypothetical protein TWF569_009014 [Orbilia oligospora]
MHSKTRESCALFMIPPGTLALGEVNIWSENGPSGGTGLVIIRLDVRDMPDEIIRSTIRKYPEQGSSKVNVLARD